MENLTTLFGLENGSAAEVIEGDKKPELKSKFGPLPTGIYDATVKYAYMDTSASGTRFIQVVLDVEGRTINLDKLWIAYKDTNKPYKVVNGKEVTIPGMQVFNSLAYIVKQITGRLLKMEQKIIMKYDFRLGKEIPVEVPCFTELTNAKVKVGLREFHRHKKQLIDGEYKPTTEIKIENTLDKFYSPEGKTAQEMVGNLPAEFGEKWLAAYKGKPFTEKLKEEPVEVSNAVEDTNTAATAKSLFGD